MFKFIMARVTAVTMNYTDCPCNAVNLIQLLDL